MTAYIIINSVGCEEQNFCQQHQTVLSRNEMLYVAIEKQETIPPSRTQGLKLIVPGRTLPFDTS